MGKLVIQLAPEVEVRVRDEAARRGLSAVDYVRHLIETSVLASADGELPPFYTTATPEEWERSFREWAAGHDTSAPPIPLEALRREHLYEGRD
jgi:hypothetical protein